MRIDKKNLEEIQNQTAIGKIEKDRKKIEISRNVSNVQIEKGNKSPKRIWEKTCDLKKKVIPKTTM